MKPAQPSLHLKSLKSSETDHEEFVIHSRRAQAIQLEWEEV